MRCGMWIFWVAIYDQCIVGLCNMALLILFYNILRLYCATQYISIFWNLLKITSQMLVCGLTSTTVPLISCKVKLARIERITICIGECFFSQRSYRSASLRAGSAVIYLINVLLYERVPRQLLSEDPCWTEQISLMETSLPPATSSSYSGVQKELKVQWEGPDLLGAAIICACVCVCFYVCALHYVCRDEGKDIRLKCQSGVVTMWSCWLSRDRLC